MYPQNDYRYYGIDTSSSASHHGVKGQKWGVRKDRSASYYRNESEYNLKEAVRKSTNNGGFYSYGAAINAAKSAIQSHKADRITKFKKNNKADKKFAKSVYKNAVNASKKDKVKAKKIFDDNAQRYRDSALRTNIFVGQPTITGYIKNIKANQYRKKSQAIDNI